MNLHLHKPTEVIKAKEITVCHIEFDAIRWRKFNNDGSSVARFQILLSYSYSQIHKHDNE